MDSLPNELLTHIVSFAIFNRSIGRLIMVNWRFNAIATRTRDSISANTLQDCALMIRYAVFRYVKIYHDNILYELKHKQHTYIVTYTTTGSVIYPYRTRFNDVTIVIHRDSIVLEFPALLRSSEDHLLRVPYKDLEKEILDKIKLIDTFDNSSRKYTCVFTI